VTRKEKSQPLGGGGGNPYDYKKKTSNARRKNVGSYGSLNGGEKGSPPKKGRGNGGFITLKKGGGGCARIEKKGRFSRKDQLHKFQGEPGGKPE